MTPAVCLAPGGRGLNEQPMQIVFRLEGRVDAWLAAGGRVETPRPSACPSCGHGRVAFAGWYPRHTRRGKVDIQRVSCTADGCGQPGHSLLPDVLVTGRIDLASVIGWGLEARAAGATHARIGGVLGVPVSTVRGWLRRADRHGGRLASRLFAVAAAADPTVRAPPFGGSVAALVAAARAAAGTVERLSDEPVDVWPFAVMQTGGRLLG